jgi:predicted metal-dependent phosphoesterase TrpH
MKYADLHIHTRYSDGSSTVEEIFATAAGAGLSCISITDHDTLASYRESERIDDLSARYEVEYIVGVEFSARWQDSELHLLGYFYPSLPGPEFKAILDQTKAERRERVFMMIRRLKAMGIPFNEIEFDKFMGDSCPSRLHIAAFLKQTGVVAEIRDAFHRYVGVGKPAYCGRFRYSVEESIAILKAAGAVVVLAHPFFIKDDQLKEFLDMGVDGLEVFYPRHTSAQVERYLNLVRDRGLVATGGSDYHGRYKEYIALGCIKLAYEHVERLKDRCRIQAELVAGS